MISNIKESLKNNDIIGLVIPDTEYEEKLIDVVCGMCGDYNKILYLSVNKPYEKLINKFGEKTDEPTNLIIYKDEGAGEPTEIVNSMRLVSPVQNYVDLMSVGGSGAMAASELAEKYKLR